MRFVRVTNEAYERFRDICLSLPEATEVFVEEWGHPTFRVGSKLKMFASCGPPDAQPFSLGMKVEKAHQQALVNTDSRVHVAAYVGKHGWINVDASEPLDWDEVREWVLESYRLNAPARLAKQVAART
jgi:predicted DNA-binding protein (MmcQ/YjbR family)